jgi:hypothetical protein
MAISLVGASNPDYSGGTPRHKPMCHGGQQSLPLLARFLAVLAVLEVDHERGHVPGGEEHDEEA